MRIQFTRIVIATLLIFSTVQPASSGATTDSTTPKERPRLSSIQEPVFFATTRRWDGTSYKTNESSSKLEFGIVSYTFANEPVRQDILDAMPAMSNLGWKLAPETHADHSDDIKRYSSKEFWEAIDSAVTKSQSDELILFVHGYADSFNDAIHHSAYFGSWFKCPVVSYAWPTPINNVPITYAQAVKRAKDCHADFSGFLTTLLDRFPGRVVIVCHSLGSLLLSDSLLDLHNAKYPSGRIKELIFSSADFDTKSFARTIAPSLDIPVHTRIYICPEDIALAASTGYHLGHHRIGAPGRDFSLLTKLPNTEVIDFSTEKVGLLAHGIPYAVISNMHKHNRPGPPWILEHSPAKIVRGVEAPLVLVKEPITKYTCANNLEQAVQNLSESLTYDEHTTRLSQLSHLFQLIYGSINAMPKPKQFQIGNSPYWTSPDSSYFRSVIWVDSQVPSIDLNVSAVFIGRIKGDDIILTGQYSNIDPTVEILRQPRTHIDADAVNKAVIEYFGAPLTKKINDYMAKSGITYPSGHK